jgi:hypothetical protein
MVETGGTELSVFELLLSPALDLNHLIQDCNGISLLFYHYIPTKTYKLFYFLLVDWKIIVFACLYLHIGMITGVSNVNLNSFNHI